MGAPEQCIHIQGAPEQLGAYKLYAKLRRCAHYVIANTSNLQVILAQIIGRCFYLIIGSLE